MVLALIGLLSTVLISGGAALLNTKPSSPQEVFWESVQEARKMALKTEHEVTIRYVDDKDLGKAFIVAGDSTKQFPIPKAGDLEVSFLSQQKGGTLVMIAGTVLETQKIELVTFYPDGTCQPFRAQFFRGGTTQLLSIDPWTCAPVLAAAENRPGT